MGKLQEILKNNNGLTFYHDAIKHKIKNGKLYQYSETFYDWDLVYLSRLSRLDINSYIETISKVCGKNGHWS